MLSFQKKVGETPLEMLNRLRIEQPDFKDSKLSYAGRLDPMAEGEMLVLVDEENKDYKEYLGYDKEYEATFLLGIETDTGDALGLIQNFIKSDEYGMFLEKEFQNVLKEEVKNLKEIKKQKYPWFSSMVVDGLKLFDHFKRGNLDIKRPTRDVNIKEIELLSIEKESKENLGKYISENISKINGEFRQTEIIKKWEKYFADDAPDFILTFSVKIKVSTGTYIRGLTENFNEPTMLLKLKRTKVFV